MNSKAEFNRSYIPRLVVEREDEESRILRESKERLEKEELMRALEDNDISWERRKDLERKLAEKKRGRTKDMEDDYSKEETQKKRPKRIRYSKMEDNWVEDA